MRRIAITLAIVSSCLGALGQGKVAFGNDSNHLFVLCDENEPLPISPLPSGMNLMAVLYAGTGSNNLALQTSIWLDATGMLMAGRMVNKNLILTGVSGGSPAYFQIFILNTGAVLPVSIGEGFNQNFVGQWYFGTSGLFTAIPGSSLTYPSLATSASASTWATDSLVVWPCLSCLPVFQVGPSNISVVAGNTASFWAYARSYQEGLQVAYQWWKNGSPIAGATNPGLTLANASLSDAGVYYVVARNIWGGARSQTATLTVLIPAAAATLGSPSYDTHNQFQFTVTGTVGTNYVVEVATNLSATTAWVSLLTNASPFTFVETNNSTFLQRFYRARY